jgi:hypothetical protein
MPDADPPKTEKGDSIGEPRDKIERPKTFEVEAHNADAAAVEYARRRNANIHSGSAGGDQDQSLEIVGFNAIASRQNRATERDLLKPSLESTRQVEPANQVIKTGDSYLLKINATENVELSKASGQRDLTTDLKEAIDRSNASWLELGQQIHKLPLIKQAEIVGASLVAASEKYNADERERSWGRLIGTVEGVGSTLETFGKIADFAAAIILNDSEKAAAAGEEFGQALGQTIVAGVRITAAADQYFFNIGFTGDYSKPFYDIVLVGMALNQKFDELGPREQERLKSKLITELVAAALIAPGGSSRVAKANELTTILDTVAVEANELRAAGKLTQIFNGQAFKESVETVKQFISDTLSGARRAEKRATHFESNADIPIVEKLDHPRRTGAIEPDIPLEKPPWRIGGEISFEGVVRQTDIESCVCAVGEMLSRGLVKQQQLINELPGKRDIADLLAYLGDGWKAGGMPDGYEKKALDCLLKGGPWGAELTKDNRFIERAHAVVVDGLNAAGDIMIRDPGYGAYTMKYDDFFKAWTYRGIFRYK